jgi:hypothetical protein
MLDGFHRAVYRQHNQLPASLRDRKVYYVVQHISEDTYEVTSFIHRCNNELERRPIHPLKPECRYFVAKGLDIQPLQSPEKVRASYGGYMVSEVTLALPVAA